jgi:hypothetical protein
VDPDPDSDPDPQHWYAEMNLEGSQVKKASLEKSKYFLMLCMDNNIVFRKISNVNTPSLYNLDVLCVIISYYHELFISFSKLHTARQIHKYFVRFDRFFSFFER